MEDSRRFCRALAILTVVLVAASSCGDDAQEDAAPQNDTSQGDASPDLGLTEGDTPDPAEPDTDQAEASESESVESALVPVQLGFRFPWCAEVQTRWNGMVDARAAVAAAEAAYRGAKEAFEAATDELDAAEARQALELVESIQEEHQSVLERAASRMVPLIIPGKPPLDDNTTVNIETHSIAVGRAREAFRVAADPATLELSELIHQVDWSAEDLTAEQKPAEPFRQPQMFGLPRDAPPGDPQDRLEATVAEIDDLQVAVVEGSTAAITALEEMGHAITLADAVGNSEDVRAAYRAAVEAMQSLGQVSIASPKDLQGIVATEHIATANMHASREISSAERDAYRKTLGEAARAVEFPDIGPQLPAWVTEEFGEAPDPDDALAYYVWSAFQHGDHLLSDVRRVGEASMLADTAAVEAFWESISESCEA